MPIDILYFREDKGGDLKSLRESMEARGSAAKSALVDQIIDADKLYVVRPYARLDLSRAGFLALGLLVESGTTRPSFCVCETR